MERSVSQFWPRYEDTSLVNLMQGIIQGLGGNESIYPALQHPAVEDLASVDNVVLLVIDRLGYQYLDTHGQYLKYHCAARLTSVFPSTTATSITTFLTGQAPMQHGLTGWFTYLKEVAGITAVLPFQLRGSQESLTDRRVTVQELYGHTPVFDLLDIESCVVSPGWILNSEFNRAHCGRARPVPFTDMDSMLDAIARLVQDHTHKKYIYAYWPDFDRLSHIHGNASEVVAEHFRQIENGIQKMLKQIPSDRCRILITADHGFIDTSQQQQIKLDEHPELQNCLTMPLSGEPRTAYCYVHPEKVDTFLNYIADNLDDKMECVNSQQLIEQGAFGLGQPHSALSGRVGDFTLLMKQNYVIKDWLLGEKPFFHTGVHGGNSEQEMFVPLIVL